MEKQQKQQKPTVPSWVDNLEKRVSGPDEIIDDSTMETNVQYNESNTRRVDTQRK